MLRASPLLTKLKPVAWYSREDQLLDRFDIHRLGEERIRDRLIEFNRLVIDAAGLNAVSDMIDDVGGDNAVDGGRFIEPVFFCYFFHFVGVGLFVLALVKNFRG